MWPMRSVAPPIENSEKPAEPERSKPWTQKRGPCASGKANEPFPAPPEQACTPASESQQSCQSRSAIRAPSRVPLESKKRNRKISPLRYAPAEKHSQEGRQHRDLSTAL